MTAYVLSPAAKRDLFATYRIGVQNFGHGQAMTYATELDRVFEHLAKFPLMARERKECRPPVRIHHHNRHYIVYLVRKTDIRILRILRDDADLARHLRRLR